jgi:alpha-2-macroglobulin
MMWLRMTRSLFGLAILGALSGGVGSQAPGAEPAASRPALSAGVAWKAADQLIAEQKFEAAASAVAQIREQARRARDAESWTLALVREVQLRIGLHGHETAVRFLREQPWPDDTRSQLVLRLYYAQALTQYLRAYGHEIRGGTRVDGTPRPTSTLSAPRGGMSSPAKPDLLMSASSTLPNDLKVWTAEQIDAEANAAYAAVWRERAALGAEPRSRIEPYLARGSYPDSVRGSLRDLTAYLWVEHLADTSLWSAAQNNERYRFKVPALLAGDATGATGASAAAPAQRTAAATAATTTALDPANPAAHPVQRLVAVLNDLHDWHVSRQTSGAARGADARQERSAALETRLELARRLSQFFSDTADRETIVADLDRRLAGARDIAWFAQGKAVQAELLLALGKPVDAHTVARSGRDAYPAEPGGQHCAALLAQIEAPEFSLQAMAADLPGKRSLRVTHRNLPRLHLRAYKVSLDARLAAHGAPLPDHRTVSDLLGKDGTRRAGLLAQWSVDLPATPDFADHATDITPPLSEHGMVMIVASPQADFRTNGANRIAATPLLLTNLVLTTRPQPGRYEVQAFDAASGTALEGVQVQLFEYSPRAALAVWPRTPVATVRSNAEGMAILAQPREQRGYFIAARRGSAWALAADYLNTQPEAQADTGSSAFIYTDRSVYRPEQKLAFKIVAYRFNSGSGRRGARTEHTLATQQDIDVQLLDANQQEVERRRVRTNSFGTASGEFSIPTGRLLGQWSLRADNGYAALRVEEYKRPTFEVALQEAAEPYRLNQAARIRGDARYYFGLPVTAGAVHWSVKRTPVYPMWHSWGRRGAGDTEQVIAGGNAVLDAQGAFEFSFTPSADERLSRRGGVSYRYQVDATVTDEGGESRSAARGFRLGFVSVEAQLASELGFVRAGSASRIDASRADLDGAPRAGSATWTLHTLQMPSQTLTPGEAPAALPDDEAVRRELRTPGDSRQPRWAGVPALVDTLRHWPVAAQQSRGSVTHGSDGRAAIELPALAAGGYRLRYRTLDNAGAEFTTQRDFLVAEEGAALPLAAALIVDRASLAVGDTLRVLVASGLQDQPIGVDLWRGEQRIARHRLIANTLGQAGVGGASAVKGTRILEIPITPDLRGGFGISLTGVRDHQVMQLSQSVLVPWDDKELKVEFSTFRDKLRPAAKEVWRVNVKPGPGNPNSAEAVSAELLAYMYDRSLDVFAPHSPPDLRSIWPTYWGAPTAATTAGARSAFVTYSNWPQVRGAPWLQADGLQWFGAYAIGGMGRGSLRMRSLGRSDARAELFSRDEVRAKSVPQSAAPAQVALESAAGARLGELMKREAKAAAPAEAPLRSNFSETAFFQPHLLTDKDGSATIEFTVPDSVTAWSVWVHALARDMRSGSTRRDAHSVKELMVRPYLPRFLREGDEAELSVQVNNAGDAPLSGKVKLEISDAASGANVDALFLGTGAETEREFRGVPARGSASVLYRLKAPTRVHGYAVKVTATSGSHSDGELRALPVLPSRLHLAQSRFVTLRNAETKLLTFDDLRGADPTRINEAMTVTVDAQLFGSVLSAVPYLQNYPYECTEQTLNRFVSSGILASVFKDNPAIAKLAAEMANRPTRLETLRHDDPNRKLSFEESPWLNQAQGKEDAAQNDADLVRVLDPKIAKAERDASLAKLAQMQLASGAFPWFAGGPESPYITLYLMAGLARAAEFNVPVPKDLVQRGWAYLATHWRGGYATRLTSLDCCWEWLTYLNFVASSYPDPSWVNGAISPAERSAILDFSFKHWKRHSPLLKGMLALTLKRAGRDADAALVFASVMDSAKSSAELGTYWAQEDRSWLWYNDTIESHAFALRVLSELQPNHAKRDGLIQWLLLNKKLSHWKSTRATAEAIYALVHAMRQDKLLGVRERISVSVNQSKTDFTFEPDRYTGRGNQVVIPGAQVNAGTAQIRVEKSTPGLAFASATWNFSTEQLPSEDRGDFFQVNRNYFRRDSVGTDVKLVPLAEGAPIKVGDQIEVHLSLRTKHAAEYVHLRDPRGAGFEPENVQSRWRHELGLAYYEEVRDSGANFFFEQLPVGEYTFRYRVRANMAGQFRVGPATLQSMYAPEFNAYSAGHRLVVR